jgi:hypothetical protein
MNQMKPLGRGPMAHLLQKFRLRGRGFDKTIVLDGRE